MIMVLGWVREKLLAMVLRRWHFMTLAVREYDANACTCLKYISNVKSINFSERSPIERMNIVTPTVTGIPPGFTIKTIAGQIIFSLHVYGMYGRLHANYGLP